MGVHAPHPSTLEHGLSDECDECKRKAADPIAHLDSEHVADLWHRMVAVEHGSSRHYLPDEYHGVRIYRTHTEMVAAKHLYRVALFLERHTEMTPWVGLPDLGHFWRNH